MESVSESMALLSLNKFPCLVKASSTSSIPRGGEDLGRGEGNNGMGKDRIKAVSPDVAAILQAPHVTTSSMFSLADKLSSRSAAVRRDVEHCMGLGRCAVEGIKALIVDAEAITDWYEQQQKDDFQVQQDVAVVDPEDQIEVVISNMSPPFEPVSQSLALADKISHKFLGFLSFSQLMANKVSNKFQGFAAFIKELRRDKGDTMEKRNRASTDVAAILRASTVTPSIMKSICDKLSSKVLATQHDYAECKRLVDSALEDLEALVVDLQYTMAWYQRQEEDDVEAQQVSFDPKDDASSQLRSLFAFLCSSTVSLQCRVVEVKHFTDDHKNIEEFLVKIQSAFGKLENYFGFQAQQDANDLDD